VIRPWQIYAEKEEILATLSNLASKFECRIECKGLEVWLLRNEGRVAECRMALEDDYFIFESVLSFNDAQIGPAEVRSAKKVMAENFQSGLWFVNEADGVREFYREFWYSDGALEGQRDGKRLKQFPSSVVYAVADPDASARYARERKRIVERL
jgi:hypothetical protein